MQDAAANIARIDPAQCRLPPNRAPITRDDVEHLAASISAHGQLVPGLVRRTQPGDPIRYEIVCGARRHFTIAELGRAWPAKAQPFYAAIRPLTDEAAFAAADRDNRNRADISDFQRATDYAHALQTYYAGNQARMAQAIQIQPTTLSRFLTFAGLPDEIFEAFGRPANLSLVDAVSLFSHLKNQANQPRLLQTARELAALQQQRVGRGYPLLEPETVLRRLQPPAPKRAPSPNPSHTVIANGRPLATGHRRPDGTLHIAFAAPLPQNRATIHAATDEIVDNLCESEKGCNDATLSAITTNSPSHAQAA
jgi:ParB family transcriptional regulator, chromosome partitioning protein